MARNNGMIALGAALLGILGGSLLLSRKPAKTTPKGPQKILWFGDSQSEVSYTFGQKTAEALRAEGHDVEVVAKTGWGLVAFRNLSLAKAKHLPTVLADRKPDVLIVAVGGNDAALNVSDDNYVGKVQATLAEAWDAGVKQVIWLGPSSVDDAKVAQGSGISGYSGKRMRILDLVRRAVGSDPRVTILPQHGHTASLARPDGLHYTPGGYSAWAEVAEPEIAAALA